MSGRMHVRILIGCQFPQQFHNVEIKIASHSNIWLAHCLQIIWLQFVCKKKSDIWQNLNITTSFVVQKRVASESLVSNLLNFRLRPRIFWLNFQKNLSLSPRALRLRYNGNCICGPWLGCYTSVAKRSSARHFWFELPQWSSLPQ